MLHHIFTQISIILGITATIAFLIRFLKQPLLVAYIISGIIAGPILLNFVHKTDPSYTTFSTLGVVLLLFVIGLSLNFNYIKKIGKIAIIAGFLQVVFTGGFSYFLLSLFGMSFFSALYLSLAITFSSTIIISKLLTEKKDTESVYGRYTIGLMLVQDIIAILIMIFMVGENNIQTSFLQSFSFLTLRITITVSTVYFLSKFVIPLILNHIAKSAEFLFLFTVAWCFGIASLVEALGLSLEIGAIVAGLSLGSSPYQAEISSRIRPLRDFFLIMFFILLGSQMNVSNFYAAIFPALGLSAFVLFVKPAILYYLFRILKFTRRNSFLTSTTSAQVSEFGFILLFAGQKFGMFGENELTIFTLTALITIFFSSYIISYNEELYRFCIPFFALFGKDKYQQSEDDIDIYDVWVIGYHRMGWKICETLREQKKSFAVIDFNPETVQHLKNQNIPAYFGDVADVEFLTELPLEKAKLVISTIPEPDDQFTLIKHIRSLTHKPHIIANLHQAQYMKDFYAAGVNYIMMPHMLGGYRISEILRNTKLSHTAFKKLRKEQENEMVMRFSARAHD